MNRPIKFILLLAMPLSLAVTSCSNNATEYYNRGVAKADQQDMDGAIACYDKAIELRPDYGDAYANHIKKG